MTLTVGVIDDGVLVESTDKWVGFTTTNDGGFLRIPMDMDYSVVFKNFSGTIGAAVKEYDVYSATANDVFNGAAENVENATVTLSLPKPGEGYTIPTGVEYKLTAQEDKGEYAYGDVNSDGNVDILDSALIQLSTNEMAELTDEQKLAADVNGDGVVDILDSALIQKYAAGKIDKFPIEKE